MILFQISPQILTQLVVAVPAAVSVIVVVVVFLKHQREERKSRDTMQTKWLNAIEKLAVPISELTIEVRLLRDRHDHHPRSSA